jgi:hypothetical protein
MSDFAGALILVGIYRAAVLVVGLCFGTMGYKLFAQGVYGNAGDFKASSGKFSVTLKNGAPGIFFALFGMAVVVGNIWKGIDIDRLNATTADRHHPAFSS